MAWIVVAESGSAPITQMPPASWYVRVIPSRSRKTLLHIKMALHDEIEFDHEIL